MIKTALSGSTNGRLFLLLYWDQDRPGVSRISRVVTCHASHVTIYTCVTSPPWEQHTVSLKDTNLFKISILSSHKQNVIISIVSQFSLFCVDAAARSVPRLYSADL